MTHERLLELVAQMNGALALISWPFIISEALGKSAPVPELKAKLDLRRAQILSAIVTDIEDTLRPFWPRRASIIMVEPEYNEEAPPVLSDTAKDEMRNCLVANESWSLEAARIRGLAGKVLRWDRRCYWFTFCTAILALAGLAVWFFYDSMSDRVAKIAIIIPLSPAVFALLTAATRQIFMHKANDAIVKEDAKQN